MTFRNVSSTREKKNTTRVYVYKVPNVAFDLENSQPANHVANRQLGCHFETMGGGESFRNYRLL